MKPLLPGWLMCVLIPLAAFARERIPLENFARSPDTARASLSPDGKYLAFVREHGGRPMLHVATLGENRTYRIGLGASEIVGAEKDLGAFLWVGDNRLLVLTMVWDSFHGSLAADYNGARAVGITGYEAEPNRADGPSTFAREVIHRFHDKDGSILMLERHDNSPGSAHRPDVLRVDTLRGRVIMEEKNDGKVAGWAADAAGQIRLGILTHGDLSGAIYRENAKAPWRTILPLKNRHGQFRPVGFDAANGRVFLAGLTEQKRWTVFPLDPATGQIGAALLSDPEYDILPELYIPTIDGHPLAAPLVSPKRDALLGIRYVTDAPRVKWFDPELARMQAAVDRLAPNTVNLLVDMSLDGKRLLWFGYSDQDPGRYYLADRDKRSFTPLAPRMSWIKPAAMAQTLNVKYSARDGLVIRGLLTVPTGRKPQGLPMVVLPHGGPWVRDVWGFDPLVQMLANRGYAVLQMNYRGSPGYGEELLHMAKRQIGRQIQDDIEDATRWAIQSGVADPKRIAICGNSYGGYSALFAAGKTPDLYRCAISIAGVTDWPAMFNKSDVAEYKLATRHWREQIGDPANDAEMLKAISPINFPEKITAPVLIIQGKEDRRVPPDQAKRMIAALEKAGRKPESLFISGLGHTWGREKQRLEIYKAIESFLAQHLGPGAE